MIKNKSLCQSDPVIYGYLQNTTVKRFLFTKFTPSISISIAKSKKPSIQGQWAKRPTKYQCQYQHHTNIIDATGTRADNKEGDWWMGPLRDVNRLGQWSKHYNSTLLRKFMTYTTVEAYTKTKMSCFSNLVAASAHWIMAIQVLGIW